eukprot:1195205-Prorocentrum_minimum.AAC.2
MSHEKEYSAKEYINIRGLYRLSLGIPTVWGMKLKFPPWRNRKKTGKNRKKTGKKPLAPTDPCQYRMYPLKTPVTPGTLVSWCSPGTCKSRAKGRHCDKRLQNIDVRRMSEDVRRESVDEPRLLLVVFDQQYAEAAKLWRPSLRCAHWTACQQSSRPHRCVYRIPDVPELPVLDGCQELQPESLKLPDLLTRAPGYIRYHIPSTSATGTSFARALIVRAHIFPMKSNEMVKFEKRLSRPVQNRLSVLRHDPGQREHLQKVVGRRDNITAIDLL